MFQLQAQKSSKARQDDAMADIRTSCNDKWLPSSASTNQWRSWPWGDTLEKLMDILLRSPLWPLNKTLKRKDPVRCSLSLSLSPLHALVFPQLVLFPANTVFEAHAAFPPLLSPSSSPRFSHTAFILLSSKGLSFASVTCFLSPHNPECSLLPPLWLSKQTFACI